MPWSVDHVSGTGISLVDKQGVEMNTLEAGRRAEAGNPATAKIMRYAYGFDDVAIVPGSYTVNPELTDVSLKVGDHVIISGNPGRNPEDKRIRLLSLLRPRDSYGWGRRPGEVVN